MARFLTHKVEGETLRTAINPSHVITVEEIEGQTLVTLVNGRRIILEIPFEAFMKELESAIDAAAFLGLVHEKKAQVADPAVSGSVDVKLPDEVDLMVPTPRPGSVLGFSGHEYIPDANGIIRVLRDDAPTLKRAGFREIPAAE